MEAFCVALKKDERLTLLLALHSFLFPLPLTQLLDGFPEQGLAVVLRPLLHQGCAQVALVPVHHVVAKHAHVRLRIPPALLLREHHRQSVGFEHRPDDRHETWEVFIKEFEVADEGEQFVDARPQDLYPGKDEMLVDGARLRRVQKREGEAILPLLVLELHVGVRDALVFTVPDLQAVHLGHLIEEIQFFNLQVRRLDYRFVSARTALVLKTVNLADQGAAVWTALVSFRSVVVDLELVVLIALGDIVMVGEALHARCFVLFGGGVIAAVPVVAIDHEDVLGVEIVVIKLSKPLFLILQRRLHAGQLRLRVYHIDGPLLVALLLANGSQPALKLRAGVNSLEGVVPLYLPEGGEGVAALDARAHVLLGPVQPNHVEAVVLALHIIITSTQ